MGPSVYGNIGYAGVAPNVWVHCTLFARTHHLFPLYHRCRFRGRTMLIGLGILAVLMFIAFSAVQTSRR
jgi:hypothetical protein